MKKWKKLQPKVINNWIINLKVNGAFEKVEKIVEKDFESNKNDEHFLLVTLTKLAIVKKA
jgi:hypothetical protein